MIESIIKDRAGYLQVSGPTVFRYLFIFIIAITGILFGFFDFGSPYYLELVDESGVVQLTLPLDEGEKFTLSYSHSVHRTPVNEIFQVSAKGQLMLVATEFTSLGVGTPFLPEEGELKEVDGKLVLEGLNRVFNQLQIRPHPLTKHCLLHRQGRYLLTDYVGAGTLVTVRVIERGIDRLFN
ncbi:MAG: DUF1850 domain-containing protein [Clostridia bacterium]|nr:DUF1850 domain-containing protein [Clostridia bacterium]